MLSPFFRCVTHGSGREGMTMPSCPRSEIVHHQEVAVYHCWSRCVRRAFLCGQDPLTGKNFDHRRDWVTGGQQQLAALFAIEIAFHAEMSNHLGVVLRTRPDIVATWSDQEVARRYLSINLLVRSPEGQLTRQPTTWRSPVS
jgi:hypothetical protein